MMRTALIKTYGNHEIYKYIYVNSIYRHKNIKNESVAFSKGSCFATLMVAHSLFTFILILFLARKCLGKLLPKGEDGFVKLEDL